MEPPENCHLLESLPPELRLRIYEDIFNEPYHSSLLIRSDSKIELISLAKAHAAILKTCRTIHREATSILYSQTTFRVQIYPAEGYPSHGNVSRLKTSTPFLSRIQHLDIKACVMVPKDIDPALRLMRTFANALEEVGANIMTLDVRSQLFPGLPAKRRIASNEELFEAAVCNTQGLETTTLFHRMLEAAESV